jgi:hypothetical protein
MNSDICIKYGLIIFAGFVLLYLISEYNVNMKKKESEKFSDNIVATVKQPTPSPVLSSGPLSAAPAVPMPKKAVTFQDSVPPSNSQPLDGSQAIPAECFPRDKLSASDLLPKDAANTKWAQANPAGQGSITDQNFLNAGYHVGINTVGSSLRNPNYQLRSDPIIERRAVSPWMQSTIAPDLTRKALEGGEC